MLVSFGTLLHIYFSSQWGEGVPPSPSPSPAPVATTSTHTWVEDFELSTGNCEQSPSLLSAAVQKCISLQAEVVPSASFFTHL